MPVDQWHSKSLPATNGLLTVMDKSGLNNRGKGAKVKGKSKK
jgi:hypothetical protein